MDLILKGKWTTALRSGEFKQCRALLKSEDGYCCLGVLAVVAGYEINYGGTGIIIDGDNVGYRPIEELVGRGNIMSDLWERNDGTGNVNQQSFVEIADHIDATL